MIGANPITTGVAANLVESATPPANLMPIVAEAFWRGLRLGLSLRRPSTGRSRRDFLSEKERGHGP